MGSRMKGTADRTKVVVRHLPPTISQSTLMEQIGEKFSGRFNFVSFRPGNNSQKHQSYSRAYIDFQRPEDVIEFAEYFGGHVFVNEKGTQFKTIVEYAPSQRVPKQWSKKDGREGTIHKDLEYLEFLEFIAKPVENLPSAEIQLERRDAERAGAVKDAPVVTPLMDFVRQKRASKGGSRRSLSNGKPARQTSGTSSASISSASLKRGCDKRKISSAMYVLRDASKSSSLKDKSASAMVPLRNDQQIAEKSVSSVAAAGSAYPSETGVPGSSDIGKKKILLLKGKAKEIPHVTSDALRQSAAPNKSPVIVDAHKQNNRHDASGKIIRSILINKDSRQNSSKLPSRNPIQLRNQEKDKRPPRPANVQLYGRSTNEAPEEKTAVNDINSLYAEKLERRAQNKDRPDRGVKTPLCRSDGLHASDGSLSSFTSPDTSLLDTAEGTYGDIKNDMTSARNGEFKHIGSRRGGHLSIDNGYYKHSGRRGTIQNGKNADGSLSLGEAKPLKRGNISSYGSQEKQVWVQKASSGP